MIKIRLIITLLAVSTLLLAGCQAERSKVRTEPPGTNTSAWKPTEVRLLDEIDGTRPQFELAALYTRRSAEEYQVRLDFLDLTERVEGDLYLAFDHAPGGLELPGERVTEGQVAEPASNPYLWDAYIKISETGGIQAYRTNPTDSEWQPLPGASIRVLRNPQLDSVEISLKRSSLDPFVPNSRLLAWTTPKDSPVRLDLAGPVLWNAAPPAPLKVLFAFNHVFPAYTPSQGLRRWDGAHTGPEGGRHGLYNLLRPASNAGLPLLLLDLASPASISALDYQGGLDLVRSLATVGYRGGSGLVTLASPLPESADPVPAAVNGRFLEENVAAMEDFDLPPGSLIYQPVRTLLRPLSGVSPGDKAEPLELAHSEGKPVIEEYPVQRQGVHKLIQLPAWPGLEDPQQASTAGLTLPWKELLIQAAVHNNRLKEDDRSRSYLVLGGSLPQSTWGQPASARAGIDYVSTRPWISVAAPSDLQPGDLLKTASWSAPTAFAEAELAQDELLEALLAAPENSASQSAWQAYRAVFAPVFPPSPRLPLLRQEYLGGIRILLKAAWWMQNRGPLADCSEDLDGDGLAECILANEYLLAVFELEGGSLSHLFLACPDDPAGKAYQVIGPSSQLITGLSDPMDWNLDGTNPSAADPGVFAGALSGPPGQFTAQITPDQLTLTSADGQTTKRFLTKPDGLLVEIRSQFPAQLPGQLVVPLVIHPTGSLQPGSQQAYESSQSPAEIAWPVDEQVELVVHTANDFREISFRDSIDTLVRTEDPNFAYPQGHYLPFPLVLLEVIPDGNLFMDIKLVCGG